MDVANILVVNHVKLVCRLFFIYLLVICFLLPHKVLDDIDEPRNFRASFAKKMSPKWWFINSKLVSYHFKRVVEYLETEINMLHVAD